MCAIKSMAYYHDLQQSCRRRDIKGEIMSVIFVANDITVPSVPQRNHDVICCKKMQICDLCFSESLSMALACRRVSKLHAKDAAEHQQY